jgi:rubrerythrin
MYPMPTPSGAALHEALVMALDDEWRARATYRAVLDAYGPVAPFSRIVEAEQRHIDALLPLFARYRLPLPYDRWTGRVTPPPTLQQACAAGVAGEIRNYQMYDALLARVSEPEAREVFVNLRNASAYRHLPAFQACAGQRATAAAPGQPGQPGANSTITDSGRWLPALAGLAIGAGLWWWLRRNQGAH